MFKNKTNSFANNDLSGKIKETFGKTNFRACSFFALFSVVVDLNPYFNAFGIFISYHVDYINTIRKMI